MKGQQITTIGFTFFVGIAAGFYLYVIGFAPQVAKVTDTLGLDTTGAVYEGLVIEASAYGNCDDMCMSYQIRNDRKFTIVIGDANPTVGELPRGVWGELEALTATGTLAAYALPSEAIACASDANGSDTQYDIAHNGEVYTLDTCRTNFSKESQLAEKLDEIENYMRSTIR